MNYDDAPFRVGDYVLPNMDVAGIDVSHTMTPCKVIATYKNGNLYARSDDKSVAWRGPLANFRNATDEVNR